MRVLIAIVLSLPPAYSQTLLDDAYTALREGRLEEAASQFDRGLTERPDHLLARKDYAYTLIRLGETAAARDQFGHVVKKDAQDWNSVLEYAFLCHETQQRAEARRIFDRVRQEAEGPPRETAEKAFQSIDSQVESRMRQWTAAVRKRPDADTVHEELARLADERDDLELAEKHYAEALRLRPTKRHFLLNLGQVRERLGKQTEALATYLAASRSPDIRTAEQGREHLPPGEPSAEVIRLARLIEPKMPLNTRREITAIDMADRSFQLGYLKDALRYYESAYENEPSNPHVQVRLGWTNNLLGNDREALQWFNEARKSSDPAIAKEAQKAWRGLRAEQAAVRATLWILPMYSTRWHSAFAYGQFKTEFRLGRLPLRPYLSLRFAGDTGANNAPGPLSERALTPAAGFATKPWRRISVWAEAGGNVGNIHGLDARAGLAHARGFGHLLGAEAPGSFYLMENGANYASRFQNNVIFATQNRVGYTAGRIQAGWLFGVSTDTQHQYWANYFEFGPSMRARVPGLPENIFLQLELVRGQNFVNRGNPRKPVYYDMRVGLWYATTY